MSKSVPVYVHLVHIHIHFVEERIQISGVSDDILGKYVYTHHYNYVGTCMWVWVQT